MKTTLRFPGLSFVRAFVQKQPAFRRTVFLFCQRFARIPLLRRSTASLLMSVMLATAAVPLLAAVTITISPTTATLTVGTTKQFTATVAGSTNTGVTWTATGGTVSSTGLYTAPATAGTYTVTVKSNANTTKKANATVTVVAAPAISSFTALKSPITAGTSTTLKGVFTKGTGTVDNGVGAVTSGTAKTVTPAVTTTYTLTVKNTANTTVTATAQVAVVPAPVATITGATPVTTGATLLTASVPSQAGSTYAWTVTGGTLTSAANTNSITYTAGAVGTLNVQCVVTNAASTAATGTKAITVIAAPTIASFTSAKSSITAGTSTTLTGTFSNGTGNVDNGIGAITSGTAKTVTPAVTTTYALTVANTAGATAIATKQIIVVAAPDSTITATTPVTSGATGLTASVPSQAGSTYAWTITSGTITSATNINSITYTAGVAGTLTLQCIVTNSVGTASTGTKAITVNPNISVSVSPVSPSLIVGDTQVFTATVSGTGNTTVTWAVQESGGGSIATNGTYTTPATPGTYHVVATSAADPTKTATATITANYLDVSGTYATNYGALTLSPQPGGQVTGSWAETRYGTGTLAPLTGTLTGNTLTGTFTLTGWTRAFSITFSPSASTFSGTFTGYWNDSNTWTGTRQVLVDVNPKLTAIQAGAPQAFVASITGSSNKAVTWAASAGTIDAAGNFVAPAQPQVVTISATSVADPTKSNSVPFQVTTDGLLDVSGTYSDNGGQTFTLFQKGNQVWGTRAVSYQIVATLSGRTLTGVQNNPDGTLLLNFVWTFAPDASSYTGLWGLGSATPSSAWNGTKQPGISVDVNPKPAALQVGALQAFTASVAGSLNKTVNWTASAGIINATGHYTAPAQPQMVTITATPVADATKAVSTQVQVTLDGFLDVSGTFTGTWPGNGTLFQNGTAVYGTLGNVVFQGTLNGHVLSGTNQDPNNGLRYFQFTFTADGSQFSGIYNATVPNPTGGAVGSGTRQPGVVSVDLTPLQPVLKVGATQAFKALVAGSSNKAVAWTASVGTVDATGLFTAPAQPQVVTVTATPAADATKAVSTQIQVTLDGILDVSGTFTGTWPGNGTYFQNGTAVYGTLGNVVFQGTLNGRVLSGTNQDPNNGLRYFQFTFTADGSQFSGIYNATVPNPTGGVVGSGTRQPGVVSLDLNPKLPVIRTGLAQDFTALVAGTLDKSKVWSATAGSINASGHFTTPSIGQVVTITAASGAAPTATTSTTVQATEDGLLDVSGNYTGYQPGNGTLYQLGTRVEGNLGGYPFQGTLNDRVLSGTNVDKNNGMSYFFQVTFTPDGNQFTGIFNGLTPNPTGGALATGTRQPGTSLRVTPSAPTVPFPWNQSFFSWVAGSLDKRVTWSVVEVGGGSITQGGVYTAPNLAGLYTVKATSIGIPALNGTATVTVPLVVTVDPKASSIRPSTTLKLKATVTGTPNPGVTWTVTEPSGGTVAADGTYTAPATIGFYHVVAASAADPTKKATAQITVQTAAPVSVSVTPYAIELNKGGTATFSASVQGASNTAVTWTASAGTINAAGNYTAPNAFGTYTVTATSVADPTAYAVATVVVKAQAGQDKAFSYDANGNMTSDGARTFEWDDENRLIAVNILVTGHRSEFKYDGLGRRVGIIEKDPDATQTLQVTSDKKYKWEGVEIAEERDATGGIVMKRFFNQGFVDSDGTTLFYTQDHIGSIRELTDGSQTVRARYDYDPYGRMTKVSGDRDSLFGYTGHLWHAQSGLNLAMYRAYDPNLGRWLNRDPIGERGGQNLYGYVSNDPVNSFDPSGLTKIHGNWCGPNWTGGHVEQYTPHQPGYYLAPIDNVDAACMIHDICYYQCRKDSPCDKGKRSDCFRACDHVLTKSAYAIGGFWGRTIGAPIDRPGKRDPGPNDCGCPGGK